MCVIWYREILSKGIFGRLVKDLKKQLRAIIKERKSGQNLQTFLHAMIDLSITESQVHFLASSKVSLGSLYTKVDTYIDDYVKHVIKEDIKRKPDPITLAKRVTEMEKHIEAILPKVTKMKVMNSCRRQVKNYFEYYLTQMFRNFIKKSFASTSTTCESHKHKVKQHFGGKRFESLIERVIEKEAERQPISEEKIN